MVRTHLEKADLNEKVFGGRKMLQIVAGIMIHLIVNQIGLLRKHFYFKKNLIGSN